jgi:hypothetical protein
MQATLEVSFFKTTVRLWLDSKEMPQCVDGVQACADEWGQKIKNMLYPRWEGGGKLSASRTPLQPLFDVLASVPGIVAAQIVEQHPDDPDIRRGYYVEYAPPTA